MRGDCPQEKGKHKEACADGCARDCCFGFAAVVSYLLFGRPLQDDTPLSCSLHLHKHIPFSECATWTLPLDQQYRSVPTAEVHPSASNKLEFRDKIFRFIVSHTPNVIFLLATDLQVACECVYIEARHVIHRTFQGCSYTAVMP